jgi:hypothetical protein
VVKALALLRENYVFPELAEQVAIGVETRLAAGEYDNLEEITLAELLTGHLQEAGKREDGEPADREASRPKMRLRERLDNFGIHRWNWSPGPTR